MDTSGTHRSWGRGLRPLGAFLVLAVVASTLAVVRQVAEAPEAHAFEGQATMREIPISFPSDVNSFGHVVGQRPGKAGVWVWDGFGEAEANFELVPGSGSNYVEELFDSGNMAGTANFDGRDHLVSWSLGQRDVVGIGDADYAYAPDSNRYLAGVAMGVFIEGEGEAMNVDVKPLRWHGPGDTATVMTNLASAFAINDDGDVFGSVETGTDSEGQKTYAFAMLESGSGPRELSGLPGDFNAVHMNDRGEVTGFRLECGETSCSYPLLRWTGSTMKTLGTGVPRDVNDNGYVVGVTGQALDKPAVWEPDGTMHLLDDLIPPGSPITRIYEVRGMSEDCKIVGRALKPSGTSQVSVSVLLELPECSDGRFEVDLSYPTHGIGLQTPVPISLTIRNNGADPVDPLAVLDEDGLDFDPEQIELLSGPVPAPPEMLAGKSSVTLEYEIKAKVMGPVEITAGASGTRGGEPVEGSEVGHLVVIPQIGVEITTDPEEIELEDTDEGTEPKDVMVEVEVTNGFDELTIFDIELELDHPEFQDEDGEVIVFPDPIPFAYRVEDPETGGMVDGLPEVQTHEELAPGESHTFEVPARAYGDGRVLLEADVTAQAGATREEAGPVAGGDEHLLAIGQDVVFYFESEPANVDERSEGNNWAIGGNSWRVVGTLENRSSTDTIRVLLTPKLVGNAFYALPIIDGEQAPDQDCAIGIIRVLEPEEELTFTAPVRTLADGGTRGIVTFEPKVEILDDSGAPEVEPTWVAAGPEQVLIGADSTEHTVHVDVSVPEPDGGDLFSHLYWYGVGTVEGLNTFLEGIVALVSMAAKAVELGLQPWLWDDAYRVAGDKVAGYLSTVYENLPDGDKEAWNESIVSAVALATGQSLVDVRDTVDAAVLERFTTLTTAYETGDSLEVARWFGELTGENIDMAIQATTFGICKLATKGASFFNKGLRAAEARLAVGAEARAAAGARALKSGDLLDYPKLRNIFGVDEVSHRLMKDLAEKWNIVVVIRRRGVGVLEKLKTGLYRLKMEAIKAKNVSEIDVEFLGFSPARADEVVIKQPPPRSEVVAKLSGASPELRAQVLERWETRWKEWYGKGADPETGLGGDPTKWERGTWGGYAEKGIPVPQNTLNPVDNIEKGFSIPADATAHVKRPTRLVEEIGTDGRPQLVIQVEDPIKGWQGVTGDIDPMAFLRPDGTEIPPEARLQLYKALRHLGFQHPESMTWTNKAGRDEYFREFNHRDPTTESMAAYHPDGRVIATRFDPGSGYVHPNPSTTTNIAASQVILKGATTQLVAGDVDPVDMEGLAPEGTDSYYVSPKTVVLIDEDCPGPAPSQGDVPVGSGGGTCPVVYRDSGSALILRLGPDGGFERWDGDEWVPFLYELGGEPLEVLPQTSLSEGTEAGDERLPINEPGDLGLDPTDDWFRVGQTVIINPGADNEERVTITGFGSLLLDRPLQFAHAAGELVTLAAPTPPNPGGGGGGGGGPAAPVDPDELCAGTGDLPFTDVAAGNVHADAIACLVELGIAQGTSATRFGPSLDVTRGQVATFIVRLLAAADVVLEVGPDVFGDDDGSVHEAAINALAGSGVVSGFGDGSIRPNTAVRRDQLASMLARTLQLVGVPLPEGPDAFGDDDGNVHEPAIDALAALGVIRGKEEPGSFDPSAATRRDQMASLLARVLSLLR